jgi:hypothetical protein
MKVVPHAERSALEIKILSRLFDAGHPLLMREDIFRLDEIDGPRAIARAIGMAQEGLLFIKDVPADQLVSLTEAGRLYLLEIYRQATA